MTAAKAVHRVIGVPGIVLVVGGAVLVLVAFRFLDWYAVPHTADSAPEINFSELRGSADQLHGTAVASAYFDWLGWLLLIAMIAVGVAANTPLRGADVLRVGGFLLGAVGVAMTYLAIAQLHDAQVASGAQRHSVFQNASWGLWLSFAGFAVGAVGSALGPRREARVEQ